MLRIKKDIQSHSHISFKISLILPYIPVVFLNLSRYEATLQDQLMFMLYDKKWNFQVQLRLSDITVAQTAFSIS